MRRRLFRIVFLCANLARALHAQTSARTGDADFTDSRNRLTSVPAYLLRTYQFAAAEGKVRAHVRFGIVNDVLQFTQEEGGRFRAAYEVNLTVVDLEQNMIEGRLWKRNLEVAAFAQTNDRQTLNEESADFLLAPGIYELRVEISDLHTQRRLRRNYPLALPDFGERRLQFSTIAFGEKAAPQDSLHYNLLALLTDAAPHAGVFYEIYGASPGDTLEAHYVISDWKKETLAEWRSAFVADSARVGHFEKLTDKLKYQGLQNLRITISGKRQKAEAEAEAGYRVQFLAQEEQDPASLLEEYPGLAYLPLRYICSNKEYKRVLDMPETPRKEAVAEFWRQRDPSPDTAHNELREEFYRRVAFAQMRFAAHGIGKAGWETDRGRIYIIYGPPQDVHHQMGELDPMPYEIWFYPKHERRFVFMDKKGSGEYELVNR